MSVIIDDHLLLAALTGRRPPQLDEAMTGEAVYTTGCWYYRLARAAASGTGERSLSGELARLRPTARTRAAGSLERLPEVIA